MARCQCGGNGCQCVVLAGSNTTVTGTGSTTNPYVVSAGTDCATVRTCLSAGPGVKYDPSTGVIGADVSAAPGNNLIIDSDGLYVPAGAATVSTGCGLTGDGSASNPVRAKTSTWPFACSLDTNGEHVYCDSSGVLRTMPRGQVTTQGFNRTTNYNNLPVPANATTIRTETMTVTNPSACLTAYVIYATEVDAAFNLPANGGGAALSYSTDEVQYIKNSGSQAINSTHIQYSRSYLGSVIPPGGSTTQSVSAVLGRGGGGATYNRIQITLRAIIINI